MSATARDVIANAVIGDRLNQETGKYEPTTIGSYRADVAIQALEAAGFAIVPKEPTEAMVRAAIENKAWDDEQKFQPLGDLIDFSGENKTRTVVKSALAAAIRRAAKETPND